MPATVLKRRSEPANRRAIAARPSDLLRQFLTEDSPISSAGELAGVLFGVTLSRATATAAVPSAAALRIYPAMKAAKLYRSEAIRYQ
jgi:ABC-type antimicrobial peptide transport system permease subunit